MDNETNSAAGEQPVATPDTTTAGAQPADRQVTAASPLDNQTPAQLLAALEATEYGEESPEIPEETEQEEPEAQFAEEEAPPADSETTTDHKPTLRRLPLGGIEEATRNEFADAAALIREGKAKNLAEAVSLLRGDEPQDQQPTATNRNEAPPTPQASASVAVIQDQIATLREQRKAAKADYDTDAELSLTDQIEDLQVALVRAEMADSANQVQAQSWEAEHNTACDQVEAKFETFAKSEPRFYQLLEDRRVAMEARQDPALLDPKFIIKEAENIAAILGWNKPAPPAPKAKAVTPNGQDIAPAHQSAGRISRPEASRMIQEIPIEELRQMVCIE